MTYKRRILAALLLLLFGLLVSTNLTQVVQAKEGEIYPLSKYNDWRKTWDIIIPLGVGNSFLFYDRNRGHGVFYTVDTRGKISRLRQHTNWRRSWDIIIPGRFGGNGFIDLLFYDRSRGEAEFYSVDHMGNISLLRRYQNWHKSWDMIIPGDFGGDHRSNDLLFYDRKAGVAQIYATGSGSAGKIRFLYQHTNWRKSWDIIIPGWFGDGQANLFFYDRSAAVAQFYYMDRKGALRLVRTHTNWPGLSMVVSGAFKADCELDLLVYNRSQGLAMFLSVDHTGNVHLLRRYSNWRKSWDIIIPYTFLSDGWYPGLLLYDRNAGEASFYRMDRLEVCLI